jgi:hypothetical protein
MTSLQHDVQPRMGASTLIEWHIGGWHCHWSLKTCHWVNMPRHIVQAVPAIMIHPHWASGTVMTLRMIMPMGNVDEMLLSQMQPLWSVHTEQVARWWHFGWQCQWAVWTKCYWAKCQPLWSFHNEQVARWWHFGWQCQWAMWTTCYWGIIAAQ